MSGRCSVSNRPDQPNNSCLFTPPSKTRLTSNAISHPAARSASSETKRSGRGEPPPQPEPELGLPIFARAKFGSRDGVDVARAASGSMKSGAKMVVVETTSEGATSVGKSIINLSSVTTVGLGLAKHVFQVHCVDALGRVVVAKAMRRSKLLEFFVSLPACVVGLEASGSAHHWARELITLGHEARMMPPAYVKPYIRRAEERCVGRVGDLRGGDPAFDAVCRCALRENQAALMRHKTREMLVSQRTQLLNALRGHLTEVGVIAPQGLRFARELAELIEACDETIPFEVCEALAPLVVQLRNLD